MRRFFLLVLVVILLTHTAWAAEESAGDAWAMILATLASDEPDPVPPAWRVAVTEKELDAAPGLDKRVLNILLLSSDAPDMGENRGRTSLMLICSVKKDTGEITLVSLPEEAQAPVQGLPQPVALEYVGCFGGPLLAVRTINEALGLNIERYCAVNFQGFVAAVDVMDGVELPLTEAEREALGLEDGVSRLSGEQALRYVRLRRGASAMERPRKLLEALLNRAVSSGLDGAFALMGNLLPMIDTNLSTGNLIDLLFAVLGGETPGAFRTAQVQPAAGQGQPVLTENEAGELRNLLYGPESP